MFPTGHAGVALVVLRSIVAATAVVNLSACWAADSAPIVRGMVGLLALCLFLGFLTPYGAALCCLLECAFLVTSPAPNRFHLATSALIAGAIAALGPGAYSVDARLFGRRLIRIPPGRESR
jgi:hypothetical protein